MWGRAVGRTCEEEGSQSGAPLGASPETEGADMTLTEETLMVRGVRGDEDGVEDVRVVRRLRRAAHPLSVFIRQPSSLSDGRTQ